MNLILGWCIFVYNLAPETEENVLWQLFGPFGAVQSVKVVKKFHLNMKHSCGFDSYKGCLMDGNNESIPDKMFGMW